MSKTTLAPIARWTVEHERIVALHIGNWSNEKIARHIKKSSVRVSQVLSDPQALRIINEAILGIRDRAMENLRTGIAELAITGLKRMKETIDFPDFVLGSDAKKHQDRLALDLAKLVYSGREDAVEEVPVLDAALSERLIKALEDSNAVDELIEEAQFEVVEEDE